MNESSKALILPAIALSVISAVLLTLTHALTRDKIADNQLKATLAVVNDILPGTFDNDFFHDVIEIRNADYFGSDVPVSVYRLRNNEEPVGVVFIPVNARGYNGAIELAVGVAYDGTLTGIRVRRHQETEGLGDGIHQDRSDWIMQFTGKSFDNPPQDQWAVKRDGGEFDQLSGATISPRSVVNAVKSTLDFYELNREKLYR